MKHDLITLGKMLAPRFVSKAIHSFDKATMVIVGACWGGAIAIMLFALYTVNMSMVAKRQVAEAAAIEPSLPKIVERAPDKKEMTPLVERLKKRFPDIAFSLGSDQSLTVSVADVSLFRLWMTVLSYVDTISPQYRWEIKTFCVGGVCPGSSPMTAVLTARKISFSNPEPQAR